MIEVEVIKSALVCGFDGWMEIWGDPIFTGTLFMLSYGLTGWMIFRAASDMTDKRERYYWRLCGALFIFQLANTNLDLHALIWTTGRCLAHAQGWYDDRRDIQLWVLIGLAILIAIILLIVLKLFYRNILRNLLLTLGVSVALGFTIVKGINFHALQQIYGIQLGQLRIAEFIEYSGIVIAFVGASMRLRQPKSKCAPLQNKG